MAQPRPRRWPGVLALLTTLAVALNLRAWNLGRLSYWYDEVVTIRLARTPDVPSLLDLMGRIDATRAPLHPILLQSVVAWFGPGEAAGRSLSVGCGVITVFLMYSIGRRAFGHRVGLWAAWLGAVSPPLVEYSREARMYALLTMLTCGAWLRLLRFRRESGPVGQAMYAALLVAIGYTHPLGLAMVATLGIGYLLDRRGSRLTLGRWVAIQVIVAVALAPWVGRYLDHPPESTVGRLPIRYLLGLPIGYVGGNFATLAGCVLLVAWGLRRADRTTSAMLMAWLALPPMALYVYSRFGHPIFGPARYTLFVGPAYLLLLANGLSRLPAPARWFFAVVGLTLARDRLDSIVWDKEAKANWRQMGHTLSMPRGRETTILLARPDPTNEAELETARYYLPPWIAIRPAFEAEAGEVQPLGTGESLVVCSRGRSTAPRTRYRGREAVERREYGVDGLQMYYYYPKR